MTLSFMVEFCSKGDFRPGKNQIKKYIEYYSWINQFARGRCLTLNLIWFAVDLEFSRSFRKFNF